MLHLQAFQDACAAEGLLISGMGGKSLRLVTHLDVGDSHVNSATEMLQKISYQMAQGTA